MAVSETIVREYFELHDFFVRQNRKHIAPKREDDEVDFYVHNPNGPTEGGEVPFVLENARDLETLTRAVVVVKIQIFRATGEQDLGLMADIGLKLSSL